MVGVSFFLVFRRRPPMGAVIPFSSQITLFNIIAPTKIGTQRKLSWLFSCCWTNLWYTDCANSIPTMPMV